MEVLGYLASYLPEYRIAQPGLAVAPRQEDRVKRPEAGMAHQPQRTQ